MEFQDLTLTRVYLSPRLWLGKSPIHRDLSILRSLRPDSIPAGCDCPVRVPDGARVVRRQERGRHLHRTAANDADAKTCSDDGTGEL